MKSITVQRNSKIVGNNSMSYDDKHPTPTITLRPIKKALLACRGMSNLWLRGYILSLRNWNKPDMLQAIARNVRA